jgi:lipopolysaccharide biosynthesis glycosyltransferase
MRHAIVTCADSAMLPAAICALWTVKLHLKQIPADFFLVISDLNPSENAAVKTFFRDAGFKVCIVDCQGHRLQDRHLGRFSQATLMRLSLEEVLPPDLDRVLYIDADVLAQGDVGPLLARPLAGKTFAAVEDLAATGYPTGKVERMPAHRHRIGLPDAAPYFNAGCLLLDWHAVTTKGLLSMARQIVLDRPDLPFFDQDALNLAGQDDWLPIESGWNRVVNRRGKVGSATLVHFAGAKKPWKSGTGSLRRTYSPLYRDVLSNTIWRDFCDPLDFGESISTILPRLVLRLSGLAGGTLARVGRWKANDLTGTPVV